MKMTEPAQVTMDDTRYLLPSEIARLVYGKPSHLLYINCHYIISCHVYILQVT